MDELLYVIPANSKKEEILNTLKAHPEIKFVSLVGIDMAGNDTDEKIPMRIFLKDIVKIALPCIVIGDIVAWVIARQWLMSFSIKASLTPLEFIYVTIALLLIIGIAVVVNCYKVANGNPVKYLKDE